MSDRPLPRGYALESGEGSVRIVERRWRPVRLLRMGLVAVGVVAGARPLEVALANAYRAHGIEALVGLVLLLVVASYALVAWTFNVVAVQLDGSALRRSFGPLPVTTSAEVPLSNVLMFAADYDIRDSDGDSHRGVPRTLRELRARPFGGRFSGAKVSWTVYAEMKEGPRMPLFEHVGSEEEAYGLRDTLRELTRA